MPDETASPKLGNCPWCASTRVRGLAYGYPTDQMLERAHRGEIMLGGCVMGRWLADRSLGCLDCGATFGVDGRVFDQGFRGRADGSLRLDVGFGF